MTDSFDDVMAFARKTTALCSDEDVVEWCDSFDGACGDCRKAVLDRLDEAHESEIAELQNDHEHEMEQLRRSRFREGYEAGRRSMDAEHYAVALRLRQLPLDEDSHGNLCQIARAIWHSDFGWTQGACAALRDELVRLLGGVHEPARTVTGGGACDADCDCHSQHPQAVTYDVLDNERHKAVCELRKLDSEHFKSKQFMGDLISSLDYDWIEKVSDYSDETVNEFLCDRLIHLLGGDEPNFTKITKTINLSGKHDSELMENVENHKIATITDELQRQVDAMSRRAESDKNGENCKTEPRNTVESSKCRENYKSCYIAYELREKIREKVNQELYVVVEADDLYAIADRIDERFARICMQQDVALDGMCDELAEVEHECDNLLDLLRDARDEYKMLDQASAETSVNFHAMRDRVWGLEAERDELQEKFEAMSRRVDQSHESSPMRQENETEIDKLRKQRNGFKRAMCAAQDLLEKRTDERDDARERLDEYKGIYEYYRDSYAQCVDNYNNMCMERDHLRDYLRKIAEHAGVQHDMMNLSVDEDDRVAKATLAAIDSKNKHVGALEWQRDRQKKLLDEYDQTHIELPKDVDGIPICAGDTVECVKDEDHVRGARDVISIIYYADKTWRVFAFKEWFEPQELRHANPDRADSIVRDLVLGKITERDAINRIQELCDA